MSSSVRVRSVDAVEARHRTSVFASIKGQFGTRYFALYSSDGAEVRIGGWDDITRFLLALGKRCELQGECKLCLVARNQMPDGLGGVEDALFHLDAYFENGSPLQGDEPVMYC